MYKYIFSIVLIANELERLSAITKSGQLTDNTLEFYFEDQLVKLFLPKASIDYVQRHILLTEAFFEEEILKYVKTTYDLNNTIICDIGANIGNHSVFFAKFCKPKQIHAFEPLKENLAILEENIKLNQLPDKITVHPIALGKKSGRASIDSSEAKNRGATQLKARDKGDFNVDSLDNINIKPDFLKIDVEGFEESVLIGAEKTLLKYKPIIWIEIFPDKFKEVHLKLTKLKYKKKYSTRDNNYFYEYSE